VLGQVSVNPTVTPTLNNGGWVYNAAVLLAVLGAVILLLVVFGYMRFAPRFQTDEQQRRGVRAPRVQPGKDVRRPVNVIGTPIVVQPPAVVPAGVGAGTAAPGSGSAPAPAPAASAAGGGTSPSPSAAAPEPAAAAPEPAAAAPEPAAAAPAPAAAAPAPAEAPAAPAPAEAPAAPAQAAPAPAERAEVALDQETFEKTLAELLAKGTDRRVAEGQARRAAMIAARKKAEG
jgi:2-oxoglutarate dehydrogenase E2 component (dihydrolipoamide succinyltransferase)